MNLNTSLHDVLCYSKNGDGTFKIPEEGTTHCIQVCNLVNLSVNDGLVIIYMYFANLSIFTEHYRLYQSGKFPWHYLHGQHLVMELRSVLMAMMKMDVRLSKFFLNFILNITISGKRLATIHSYPKTRIFHKFQK